MRLTMNFGDACSSWVIRIIQLTFLIKMTEIKMVQQILKTGAYADNYSSSFQTKDEYKVAKDEMNRIHDKIGLPLKGTYCAVKTDAGVLKELEKDKDEEPVYAFLGMAWNLQRDNMKPLARFNLGKKSKGTSADEDLMDMDPTDIETKTFAWGLTRRNISRICAQAYDRLGAMLGPAYGCIRYITSENDKGEEECNIITARSIIGKKSVPGHEVLSANQAAEA